MYKHKLSNKIKKQLRDIILKNKGCSDTDVISLMKYVESGNWMTLKRVENILARTLIGNVYWHVEDVCQVCYVGHYQQGHCKDCGTTVHPGWVNSRTRKPIPHNLKTLTYILKTVVINPKYNYTTIMEHAVNGNYRFLNGNLYVWALNYFPAIGDVPINRTCLGLINRLSNRGIRFDHIPSSDMLYAHLLAKDLFAENKWAESIKHRCVGLGYVANKKIALKYRGPIGPERKGTFNDTWRPLA